MEFRIAAAQDYDLLRQFRVECGWGTEKLEQSLIDPDRVVCVLERDGEDVGMGMWCLEYPPKKSMASRADRVVHLASLFIRHKHQGKGYGAEAMDLLETVAVKQYNAEWITLDTVAFYVEHVDGFAIEDQTRPGRTIGWYNKRGYREFLDRVPLFPESTRDGGTLLLTAAFLRKRA